MSILLRQSLQRLTEYQSFQCAASLGMRRLRNIYRLVFLRTWNANDTSATVILYSIADKDIPSVRCIQKGKYISFHQISFNRYFKVYSVYQFRMLTCHNWQMRSFKIPTHAPCLKNTVKHCLVKTL